LREIISKERIKIALEQKGLNIIGEIKTTNDKVLCSTNEGYFVLALPSSIIRRNDNPPIFSKYNPYTIKNIEQYLKLNGLTSTLVSNEYINANSKLEWKCECGKIFETNWQTIKDGKKYCNFCAKSKRWDNLVNYNKLVKEECDRRNYELLPNQDIQRNDSRFKYICNKHKNFGVQESNPSEFITSYGQGGCTQCCIEKRSYSKRLSKDYLRQITEDIGFIFIGTQYANSEKTKIIYKCKKHLEKGNFSSSISNIKRSNGRCPCCIGRFRTKGDLQFELDEMNACIEVVEYTEYASDILCKCKICGHTWTSKGVNLTQGHGCPDCHKSKFELNLKYILDKYDIKYKSQYWFDNCRNKNPLPFDFYIEDYNLLIEADGEGHYIPIPWSSSWTEEETLKNLEKTKMRDEIKTKYCEDNNIPLIRIPYWEKDNLENYILRKLKENSVIVA